MSGVFVTAEILNKFSQVVKLDTDFNLTQLARLRLTKKVNRKLFQITSTLCVQSSFSQNKVDKERQIKV